MAFKIVFNAFRVVVQMPLPWGQILVTNSLQIPTCCPTWGRWGMKMIDALVLCVSYRSPTCLCIISTILIIIN